MKTLRMIINHTVIVLSHGGGGGMVRNLVFCPVLPFFFSSTCLFCFLTLVECFCKLSVLVLSIWEIITTTTTITTLLMN